MWTEVMYAWKISAPDPYIHFCNTQRMRVNMSVHFQCTLQCRVASGLAEFFWVLFTACGLRMRMHTCALIWLSERLFNDWTVVLHISSAWLFVRHQCWLHQLKNLRCQNFLTSARSEGRLRMLCWRAALELRVRQKENVKKRPIIPIHYVKKSSESKNSQCRAHNLRDMNNVWYHSKIYQDRSFLNKIWWSDSLAGWIQKYVFWCDHKNSCYAEKGCRYCTGKWFELLNFRHIIEPAGQSDHAYWLP